MSTADLQTALKVAEAELNLIAEQAKEAYRTFRALDQQQTAKADYIRELKRQIQQQERQP